MLLAVGVQLMFGIAWTVLEPPYAGLDEPDHVAGVLQLVYHDTWPAPKHLVVTQGVLTTYAQTLHAQQQAHALAPPQARDQRMSLAAAGGSQTSSSRSQMSQHPPLYYAMTALLVRLAPAAQHAHWDQLIGFMRLVGAVLVAPLPLIGWALMRRFSARRELAHAGALVPLLVPSLSRVAGSVSNDSLLILLMSVVGLGVARIATGDCSRRTAAWTGVAAMLALLTKGTALVVPAWIGLAYLWCWWKGRRPVTGALLTAAVPVAIGLLWWVRNVVVFGAVQPAGVASIPGAPGRNYHQFVDVFFSGISYRFWSALGNPEPPSLDRSLIQSATYVTLALLLVGLVVVGPLPRPHRRRAPDPTVASPTRHDDTAGASAETGGRIASLVVLFGPAAVLAIITEGSFAAYRTTSRFSGVQGRYLYPVLLPIAVLPLLGLGALLRGRLRPLLPIAVAALACLLQADSVLDVFHTIWDPVGGTLAQGLHQLLQWSPWDAAIVYGGALLTVAAGLGLAAALLADTVSGLLRPTAQPS